ncbi:exopolysaccharide biosynthesis polyprenyl glycosylphosphotransferase [Kitasatospora sp. SolWspMP-SS2h]|uniref:sugar transferase n=1 Tax=Kitasatospora sp. SolWspMP-SS2h TaxID=1305729 RepID=UPI000DBAA804|nr:sugar transferase [Kitasatospora sp. SolWspMP-SS2h]RAJ44091.1 exopolysaccharide biosynthesis polyprenyl glycosylphosphotransferase [Kitasatospora sp. SolWspMP-SS2h]
MTIDHESVPRPGRTLTGPGRPGGRAGTAPGAGPGTAPGTGVLDRPRLRTKGRPKSRAATPRTSAGVGRHRGRLHSRVALPLALAAADALAVGLAAAATTPAGTRPVATAALLLPALLPLNLAGGLYRTRLSLSALDELPGLAARAAVATAFAITADTCLAGRWADLGPVSPLRLLALLLLLLPLAALGRAFVHHLTRRARRRRPSPVLILGAGELGQRIAAVLTDRPEYGLRPVGYLDPDPVLLPPGAPLPVLGGREVLGRVLRRYRIHHVLATAGAADEAETLAALRHAARLGCQVWLVPGLREFDAVRGAGDHLWGFPCLRLEAPAMRRGGWAVKRGFDIASAGLGLLLISPLLAACALAVRWDTGPGVLFRQQRTGLDGRVFTVLKFRTLRPSDEHESATRWNIAQDHRMGAIGKFLRRTSLDELPQLWNVLRGDMSLVGPRPERPYFVMRFGQAYPEYADRHRVPVGLTGLAQVNGLRGDTSIEDRARFDNRYIEGWSLWGDAKILLRTAALAVRPDGS